MKFITFYFSTCLLNMNQVADLLGLSSDSDSSSLSLRYCSGSTPANANIKPEVHKLNHDLVLHIHKNEPDIEKSILVFLPTYYSLEQQWHLLKPLSSSFKVHILHSSVDTEQALMAMRIWKSHRKVSLLDIALTKKNKMVAYFNTSPSELTSHGRANKLL